MRREHAGIVWLVSVAISTSDFRSTCAPTPSFAPHAYRSDPFVGDRCFVVRRDICVLARSCTDELPHQCILRRLRTLCLVHRRHRTRSAQDSGDSRYPVPCWAAPCGRAQVCIRVPRARTGAAALYMLMWSSGRARTLNTVGCDTACGRRSDARDPNLQHIMRRQSTQ